jgi:hypothetical protein
LEALLDGVSSMWDCAYSPTPMRRTLKRNGTRHPHVRNASMETAAVIARKTTFDRMSATGTPSWAKLP